MPVLEVSLTTFLIRYTRRAKRTRSEMSKTCLPELWVIVFWKNNRNMESWQQEKNEPKKYVISNRTKRWGLAQFLKHEIYSIHKGQAALCIH